MVFINVRFRIEIILYVGRRAYSWTTEKRSR